MEDARVGKDEFKVLGRDVAKGFTIAFKGTAGLAAQRVARAHKALKRDDGTWRQLESDGDGGEVVRLYAGKDKSPKTIRGEIFTNKLARILSIRFPQQVEQGKSKFFANRKDARVMFDWTPLAKVVVKDRGTSEVQWNPELVTKIGIDKNEIMQLFEARQSEREEIQWPL